MLGAKLTTLVTLALALALVLSLALTFAHSPSPPHPRPALVPPSPHPHLHPQPCPHPHRNPPKKVASGYNATIFAYGQVGRFRVQGLRLAALVQGLGFAALGLDGGVGWISNLSPPHS